MYNQKLSAASIAVLIVFGSLLALCAGTVFADSSDLNGQLSELRETSKQQPRLFDDKQGWGIEYRYYFPKYSTNASGAWFDSGDTKIAVYNSSGKNVGSIDLANIINNGKIDLLAYTGLANNISCTGELALTYGNDYELSYMRLYGNAVANNQILTHPNNGAINSYVASTLSSSFHADIIGFQKKWNVFQMDIIGFQVLAGLKEFVAGYDYDLTTAVPSDIIKPCYSGSVSSGFTVPFPVVGAGFTVNFGDVYLSANVSGWPGIPSLIREKYLDDLDASILQGGLDVDYRLADYATLKAGYSYFGLGASIPAAVINKYSSPTFVFPTNIAPIGLKFEQSALYAGLNIHL